MASGFDSDKATPPSAVRRVCPITNAGGGRRGWAVTEVPIKAVVNRDALTGSLDGSGTFIADETFCVLVLGIPKLNLMELEGRGRLAEVLIDSRFKKQRSNASSTASEIARVVAPDDRRPATIGAIVTAISTSDDDRGRAPELVGVAMPLAFVKNTACSRVIANVVCFINRPDAGLVFKNSYNLKRDFPNVVNKTGFGGVVSAFGVGIRTVCVCLVAKKLETLDVINRDLTAPIYNETRGIFSNTDSTCLGMLGSFWGYVASEKRLFRALSDPVGAVALVIESCY